MPRLRVLLMDDSRTVQATLGRGLKEAGFVAGDMVEALDHLAQRRCAVVLTDHQLPGTNGLDFLAALRGAYPEAPLILYSSSMTPELAAQVRGFGVAALLEKPAAPGRLVEVVRPATALDGRRPHPAAEP